MIFLIVSILIIDRVTKIAAERLLPLNGSVPVIKGFFHLTLVHNTGAAFGLFRNLLMLLVLASVGVLFFLWFSLMKARRTPRLAAYRLPLSLIFAGALGNLIDRLFVGYVIDFLDLRVWPVFNIADSAITVGAALFLFLMLTEKGRNKAGQQSGLPGRSS